MALSDSTAQVIGASSPERGYVGLLAERLRQETGQPVQVINLSQLGGNVRDVVDTRLAQDIDPYDSTASPPTLTTSPLRSRPAP